MHRRAAQLVDGVVAAYRREFRPSAQLDRPYVIAGVNVVAADTTAAARERFQATRRAFATGLFGRGQSFTDEQADQLLAQGADAHVDQMLQYSALGTPAEVRDYFEAFVGQAGADELIVAHHATDEARLRSVATVAGCPTPARRRQRGRQRWPRTRPRR